MNSSPRLTNFSTEWVDSLLELAADPLKLQLMIVDDVIKPTFAIGTIKEHSDQALRVLKEALARKARAKEEPARGTDTVGEVTSAPKKVRLTAKDLTSSEVRKFQNAVKREAPVMYETLTDVTADPAFATLATETREKLMALMEKLKKLEVPSREPDPRQPALFDTEDKAVNLAASTDASGA